jgi:hypothetical protein
VTARICYLKRADRGDLLAGVRLVGAYTDDSWQAPANTGGEFDPVEHVRLTAHAAGEWIDHALRSGKGARTIDAVCLDVEGSACAWVTAPSAQHAVVSAAYAHLGGSDDGGGVAIAPAELSTIEPMTSIAAGSGEERRVGLIASPDSVARLILDELDQRGIAVQRVASLWQMLAQAWDPGGPGGDLVHTRLREDRVVATDQPTMAIVMIEPTGKLVWVWSRAGEPIAGGSMRLRAGASGCAIAPWDVSRLGTEWLAWSAQTGEAPRRVLIVTPDLDERPDQLDPSDHTNVNDQADEKPSALSPAEFGQLLGNAWQGATIDMAIEPDPLGETLVRASRIAESSAGDKVALTSLTRRPGRAHRSAYRWTALALLAAAAALAAYAFSQFQQAGAIAAQVEPLRERQRDILLQSVAHKELASEPVGLVPAQLRDELEQKNANRKTVRDADKPKPVLEELLNIALQFEGYEYDGIKPKLIHLNPLACRIDLWVPKPTLAYDFLESLKEASEAIEWDDEPKESGATKDLLAPWSITGAFQSPSSP